MKRYLVFLIYFTIVFGAAAEEIDGEIDISFVKPYDRFAPSFCGSFRPEFLKWRSFSLGAGLALHISSRYSYETTDYMAIPDSTDWYFFNENLIEMVNFEFFGETRWRFLGRSDEAHWKGWLSLNFGAMIHSSNKTTYLTQFEGDTLGYVTDTRKYAITFKAKYRTDPFLSPGLLIGIGNFIVGYKHWIYYDDFTLELGKPGRTVGTLRVGYRFLW